MRSAYLFERLRRNMRAHVGNYTLAFLGLTIVFLALTFVLAAFGNLEASPLLDDEAGEAFVLVSRDASEDDLTALRTVLESAFGAGAASLLEPAEVKRVVGAELGGETLTGADSLEAWVFPAAVRIEHAANVLRGAGDVWKRVQSLSFVESVVVPPAPVQAKGVKIVDLWPWFVGLFGLGLLSVVAMVTNTTRLSYLSRRREVELSRFFGATTRFVCRPFVVDGMLQAGFSALAAVIAGFFIWNVTMRFMPSATLAEWRYLSATTGALMVVGAACLGALGGRLAARGGRVSHEVASA